MLRAIARHGLILATAHLGRDDTFAVVDGALEEGVAHIVVTHPEFTCQNFSIEDQVALADRGCLIERCLTTPYSGKTTCEHVFDGVRAVGIERNFFSSDCGNPDYPPVEDGLAIWADTLLEAGFDEDEIREHDRRPARGGWWERHEQSDARGRRALGRLRLAGGRRDRGHDRRRRHRARARALLRRARRVRRALEGAGPDGRAREGSPPRRGRARRGGARRGLRVPRPRRLPARGRHGPRSRRSPTGSASSSPDVVLTHTDRDPFNPDHAVAFFAVERARALAAGAGTASAFESDRPAGAACSSSRTSRSSATSRRPSFVDITPVIEQKRAAMAEMQAQAHLHAYYDAARLAARQPRPPLVGEQGDRVRRGVPARDAPGSELAVSALRGAGRARFGDRARSRRPARRWSTSTSSR